MQKVVIIKLILLWRKIHDRFYAKCYLQASSSDLQNRTDIIVVAGFFSTASGIGELARSSYRLLMSRGFRVVAIDLSPIFDQVDYKSDIQFGCLPQNESGVLLLYANGGETIYSLRKLGISIKQGWKIIGIWAWELSDFPKKWSEALLVVSQVWTYSNFSARALSKHSVGKNVVCIPPFIFDYVDEIILDDFEIVIPKGKFVFLTMCDSRSSIERKNPLGAIKAFKQAFQNNEDVLLIVKTRNFGSDEIAQSLLNKAVTGHNNIHWVDDSLNRNQYWSMLSRIDCFVSLHRAEGFGLPMAEAMKLGKPVIATNWSANLDFMNHSTSLLIDYNLISIPSEEKVYGKIKSYWADPNIDQTAQYMRNIVLKPELYVSLSISSARKINELFSADEIITKMKNSMY